MTDNTEWITRCLLDAADGRITSSDLVTTLGRKQCNTLRFEYEDAIADYATIRLWCNWLSGPAAKQPESSLGSQLRKGIQKARKRGLELANRSEQELAKIASRPFEFHGIRIRVPQERGRLLRLMQALGSQIFFWCEGSIAANSARLARVRSWQHLPDGRVIARGGEEIMAAPGSVRSTVSFTATDPHDIYLRHKQIDDIAENKWIGAVNGFHFSGTDAVDRMPDVLVEQTMALEPRPNMDEIRGLARTMFEINAVRRGDAAWRCSPSLALTLAARRSFSRSYGFVQCVREVLLDWLWDADRDKAGTVPWALSQDDRTAQIACNMHFCDAYFFNMDGLMWPASIIEFGLLLPALTKEGFPVHGLRSICKSVYDQLNAIHELITKKLVGCLNQHFPMFGPEVLTKIEALRQSDIPVGRTEEALTSAAFILVMQDLKQAELEIWQEIEESIEVQTAQSVYALILGSKEPLSEKDAVDRVVSKLCGVIGHAHRTGGFRHV